MLKNNCGKKAVIGFIRQLTDCMYNVRYDKLCDLIKRVIKKQNPNFRWTTRFDRGVIF